MARRLLHYAILAAVLLGVPALCAWWGADARIWDGVRSFPPRTEFLLHDDRKLDRNGTATSDAPLVLSTALASPGFVRLKVEVEDNGAWLSGNTQVFDGGAGADVLNIPEWPAPADFRAFWTETTNTLFTTPYAPVCTNFTPTDAAAGVSYFLFELPTVHGQRPATGILAMPEDAAAASCGLIATFNGYGFGATPLPNAANVRRGNIVVAVTRHGEDPVHSDAAYYKNLENVEMKGFCFRNLDKKVEDTDQYGMILRGLRARLEAHHRLKIKDEALDKAVALSVRCAARAASGDTAPCPAGKYGGFDTIKSRLSLSNGALR